MEFSKPINLLMPFKGHRIVVRIHGHLDGTIAAQAGPGGELKAIPTRRLFTSRVDKPSRYSHVDVTCTKPSAMLDGWLKTGAITQNEVEFRACGRGPTRRDTIHLRRI